MDFDNMLQRSSLKITPQRLLILKCIEDAGHIDIDCIYNDVRKLYPSISLATVYKNIKQMVEGGLITEVPLLGKKTFYEIKKDSHIHFICKKCLTVYDIHEKVTATDISSAIPGTTELVEVNIYGICNKCKHKS
jgi:Fe2+ or Zn2+ uptake regulation protein